MRNTREKNTIYPSCNIPATPLTDPAKFGIPVKRPQRTKQSQSSAVKAHAAPSSVSTPKSTPKRNEVASKAQTPSKPMTAPAPKDKMRLSLDKLDAGSGSDAGSSPSSPKKKGGAGLMKTITGMFKGRTSIKIRIFCLEFTVQVVHTSKY